MTTKVDFYSLVKWLLLCGWFALFIGGMIHYAGSCLIYTMFSVVFLAMLVSGFYRHVSYGYLFLVVFLWLGFWLKLTVHAIFNYSFGEPFGSFNGTAAAWDEVLWVAIVASMGVVMGRILYGFAGRKSTIPIPEGSAGAPVWYPMIRKWLWLSLLVAVVGLASLNIALGIQQSGLVPRTILPWPLNAVIYWMLSIGLSMGVATLLWWDISLRKTITFPIYAIHAEAFFSSVSVLSRGVYIFHAIPQMLSLYMNRQAPRGVPLKKAILIAFFFVSFFVVSLAAVNATRSYLYSHGQNFTTKSQVIYSRLEVIDGTIPQVKALIKKGKPLEAREHGKDERFEKWLDGKGVSLENILQDLNKEKASLEKIQLAENAKAVEAAKTKSGQYLMLLDEFVYQIINVAGRISQLAVDRWVGLEGVMAVSSYPIKSDALFMSALTERPKIGDVTLYQKACNSQYQTEDMSKFAFASLPGPAAFFYYTGSLWLVFIGMFAVVLVALFSESLVQSLTGNALLCALYGMDVANSIAQLGVAPRQLVIHFFMICCGVGFIWILQSKLVAYSGPQF